MKKCFFFLITILAVLMLTTALADETITLSPAGSSSSDSTVTIDGQTVTITQEGTYIVTGELTDGTLVIEVGKKEDVTLVLSGVSITNSTGAALSVVQADEVTIETADGTVNTLQSGEEASAETDASDEETASGGALYSNDDLIFRGEGTLTVLGYLNNGIHCTADIEIESGAIHVTAVNHGIKGKKSVTVTGGQIDIVSGKDGITSDELDNAEKGFVSIDGGEITITSTGDGISAETALTVSGGTISIVSGGGSASVQSRTMSNGWWDFDTASDTTDDISCKGLKSAQSIAISGGVLIVDAADDAVHSDDTITISGGEMSLSSGDDGVHADKSLTISGGTITIPTSYEGLEAVEITISGGDIDITASDDGINANGGSNNLGFGGEWGGSRGGRSGEQTSEASGEEEEMPTLVITGGRLTVTADGDGLDTNGDLRVEGGEITINGPTNGGNGAIDIGTENGGTAFISGGTIIALGASDMAEGFGDTSTQCAFLVTTNTYTAGQTITIADSKGNVIYTSETTRSGSSVVFSSPDLTVGETYTITIGSMTATVSQTATVVGSGFSGGGFGNNGSFGGSGGFNDNGGFGGGGFGGNGGGQGDGGFGGNGGGW